MTKSGYPLQAGGRGDQAGVPIKWACEEVPEGESRRVMWLETESETMTALINEIERTYRRLKSEGREILRLFSGNPNEQGFLFPEKPLQKAYRHYFDHQDYRPEPKGLRVARQSIAEDYRQQGVALDPENIVLTSGTSESFLYLLKLLAKPGENVLIPHPAYPMVEPIAGIPGITLKPYPLVEEAGWALDMEALKRQTDTKTRAIILISPHNPTGWVASRKEVEAVTGWCREKDLALIVDEVFSEFIFEGETTRPASLDRAPLVFTLNGISKRFALPALKLGWVAVTGEEPRVSTAVDRLETMADTFLSCHIPIQRALPHLFDAGASFVKGYRTEVGRRRKLAIEILSPSPRIRLVPPQGGVYLMAKIEGISGLTEEQFVIRLMEEEAVFVHPGYFYDYERGIHIVVSYLTREEELRRGLSALIHFTERHA